jgi:hypothetical protein
MIYDIGTRTTSRCSIIPEWSNGGEWIRCQSHKIFTAVIYGTSAIYPSDFDKGCTNISKILLKSFVTLVTGDSLIKLFCLKLCHWQYISFCFCLMLC